MNYKKELENITNTDNSLLNRYVAGYILDNMNGYSGTDKEKITAWYKDLMMGGCKSGFVGSLIYYTDTHKFFDKYYTEIMELAEEVEEQTGIKLQHESDLKNWYAWFGFEETARKIVESNLKIEN
jgi:hypothetical protein